MPATLAAPTADLAVRDRLLAARAARGDTAAFAELHARHGSRMRRAAMRVLRDPHEAEDAVQEAWIRAAARIGTCDEPGPWLIAVTRNEALRMLRRRVRGAVPVEGVPERPDPSADPGALAERSEERRVVRAVVDALPGPYREAALRELAGQRPAEVADAMGIAPGAARVRLHRARRMMGEGLVAAGLAA